MATTTNFGWTTPDDTDYVKDGAAAIRTLGSAIDTSLVDLKGGTTGQVLAKASNTDMDFTWASDATGIPATIFDAKGDLIVASAADTAARLAVGTNGYVLTADSAEATGVKWAAATASVSFVGCGVNKTADQSISSDVSTAITFTGEDFDTDAFHSTSTNTSRLTIPAGKGGKYLIYGYLSYQDNGTGSRATHINLNGSSRIASFARVQAVTEAGSNTAIGGSFIYNLSAGDYIELVGYQKSGGSLNVLGSASPDDWRSRFGLYYLGA